MERKIRTIVSTSKCGRKAQVITDGNETKHVRLLSPHSSGLKGLMSSSLWADTDENIYRYGV